MDPFVMDARTYYEERISYNTNGDPEYVGLAIPGTEETEPGWLIQKFIYQAKMQVVAKKFANKEAKYNKVWSDRTLYNY